MFIGNRFTAVSAVKVARETPDTTKLQFQCEMLTEWLTSSLNYLPLVPQQLERSS